ncbi:MAG TPA: hypothetical protein VFH87_00745 [Candidatus Udaeobacter sp.]|nr:hypothetical protein [Candidatus Udaeobacter sp.]
MKKWGEWTEDDVIKLLGNTNGGCQRIADAYNAAIRAQQELHDSKMASVLALLLNLFHDDNTNEDQRPIIWKEIEAIGDTGSYLIDEIRKLRAQQQHDAATDSSAGAEPTTDASEGQASVIGRTAGSSPATGAAANVREWTPDDLGPWGLKRGAAQLLCDKINAALRAQQQPSEVAGIKVRWAQQEDTELLDELERRVFTNREGEHELHLDFTLPTLREAIRAAAQQQK